MKEEVIRGNHEELMSYRNLSIKMSYLMKTRYLKPDAGRADDKSFLISKHKFSCIFNPV